MRVRETESSISEDYTAMTTQATSPDRHTVSPFWTGFFYQKTSILGVVQFSFFNVSIIIQILILSIITITVEHFTSAILNLSMRSDSKQTPSAN